MNNLNNDLKDDDYYFESFTNYLREYDTLDSTNNQVNLRILDIIRNNYNKENNKDMYESTIPIVTQPFCNYDDINKKNNHGFALFNIEKTFNVTKVVDLSKDKGGEKKKVNKKTDSSEKRDKPKDTNYKKRDSKSKDSVDKKKGESKQKDNNEKKRDSKGSPTNDKKRDNKTNGIHDKRKDTKRDMKNVNKEMDIEQNKEMDKKKKKKKMM
ncbi:hypothetical protein PFTANZ_03922 [Plasmodium falciparum Tanzania (2000708)]|uniref:Uncharacterized protein n=1 Tax=Plasmodium falciparum Tanzania (2000708) TaxID=1036725 RepID=A0A024W455_PLAFA|nr:hypothetical protein PFTANZ_03922 [Plasmodium falciparum Tanzania (2000708)]